MEVNEKCDVYSFGVLLLEVIMGRHPGDLILSLSSPTTLATAYGVLLKELLDQRLKLPSDQVAEKVITAVKLAFACLHLSPQSRPSMKQVSVELTKQMPALQSSLNVITVGQLFDPQSSTS